MNVYEETKQIPKPKPEPQKNMKPKTCEIDI
jgi:hypothetical protein